MWKTRLGRRSPESRPPVSGRVARGHRFTGEVLRKGDGASLVEVALILPLLLLLFFGIFEFGRQFYVRLTVRHAVAEATRYAVTGNQLLDPETLEPIGRVESITRVLRENAGPLQIGSEHVTIDPPDGGGPEDVVTVTVTYRYEYSLPGFDRLPPSQFTVTTAMRNEPFHP